MQVIDEDHTVRGNDRESEGESRDGNGEMRERPSNARVQELKHGGGGRPAPLEILDRVKFNTSQETPRSTIKGFLNLPNQADLKFTRDNLKKAEDQLKTAFVGFYQKLRLLKNYSFLNTMAFSKIMKKYDKVTLN